MHICQTYLSTLDTRVEIMKADKDVPKGMEIVIGSIMVCRGKFNIGELDSVYDLLSFSHQ